MVKLKAEMVPILVVLTIYALYGTGSKSIYLSSNKHHIILTSSSKQICTPSKMLLGCNVQHNRTLGSYISLSSYINGRSKLSKQKKELQLKLTDAKVRDHPFSGL